MPLSWNEIKTRAVTFAKEWEVVCEAFQIDPVTVRTGVRELSSGQSALPSGGIRRAGGGRKKILQSPNLPKVFAQVVENYTAGSPTDEAIK